MSRKRRPTCGVSLKSHYIERERWTVALLTVTRNPQGKLAWQPLKGIKSYTFFSVAALDAERIAYDCGVDLYLNCTRGNLVDKEDERKLLKNGLLDHLK